MRSISFGLREAGSFLSNLVAIKVSFSDGFSIPFLFIRLPANLNGFP